MSWMQRLKRVFAIDLETGPDGAGKLRVIACIEDPQQVLSLIETQWVADPGQRAASGWMIGISGAKIESRVAGSDALRAYPSVQRKTPSCLPRRRYLLESGNMCLIRPIRVTTILFSASWFSV